MTIEKIHKGMEAMKAISEAFIAFQDTCFVKDIIDEAKGSNSLEEIDDALNIAYADRELTACIMKMNDVLADYSLKKIGARMNAIEELLNRQNDGEG